MNTNDLARILEEIHWEKYAEFDNPPHHIKSLRHRIRWHRFIKHAFEKPEEPVVHSKMKLTPRRLVILLVIIFTAVLTAAAIIVWYGNIYGQKHSNNMEFFAISDNAPEVIDEVYNLTGLPKGFELVSETGGIGFRFYSRQYVYNDKTIVFEQITKIGFRNNNDIERSIEENIIINGQNGILFYDDNIFIILIDVDKYILRITTNLSKNEALDLCKYTN